MKIKIILKYQKIKTIIKENINEFKFQNMTAQYYMEMKRIIKEFSNT